MVRETVPSQQLQYHSKPMDKDNDHSALSLKLKTFRSSWITRICRWQEEWHHEKLKHNHSNPRSLPRCYESAKTKFKKPRRCHAKAQTDQGVSNGRKIPHPKTSCQNLKQTPHMPLKCENHSNLTWHKLQNLSFTRGIWCRRRGSTVPTSGNANKQRTFNHLFSHALCPKVFWVWRSIGSIASSWNILFQSFSVWWKLIGLHCCFHLQPETPPATPLMLLTGVTLALSRMVMLLRDWALWPPWQTGRTLSSAVTLSARGWPWNGLMQGHFFWRRGLE